MQRSPNEQVPHTATTLHQIPRFKDRPALATEPRRSPAGRDIPLIHFHREQVGVSDRPAVGRDLGVALATMNRALPGTTPAAAGRMALPLLDASVAADPADGPAWAARGTALWLLARRDESLAAFRTALGLAPESEETLVAAGTRSAQMRKGEEALADFSKAVAINPWRADYHQVLALAHSQARRWEAAIEAARDAIRLNPFNHEARLLLVQGLLAGRRPSEARAEFQALLDQDPPGRDELKAWFDGSASRSIGR
jgi:tetratricopeptide (TPR) repeat protein